MYNYTLSSAVLAQMLFLTEYFLNTVTSLLFGHGLFSFWIIHA